MNLRLCRAASSLITPEHSSQAIGLVAKALPYMVKARALRFGSWALGKIGGAS